MLVNKTPTIPLVDYLHDYLKNKKLTNFMTGKTYSAFDVMNWDKSHLLWIIDKNKYSIAPNLKFATKSKFFGDTYEVKTLKPKAIRKNVKVPYEVIYTEYVEKTYRRKTGRFKTVFSLKKIGKNYFWTTQYKPVYRTYKKIVPKITKGIAYETKKVIVGYTQPKTEEILKYIYKFRLYVAFFLIERYIYRPRQYPVYDERLKRNVYVDDKNNYEMTHEVVIETFYQDRMFPLHFGLQPYKGSKNIEFSTPQEMVDKGITADVLRWAKEQINEARPKDNLQRLKKFYIENKHDLIDDSYKEYLGHYHYDEQILDLVFFMDYDTRPDNIKIEVVQ